MPERINEVGLQRQYYTQTAEHYDQMHGGQPDEHSLSLSWLVGVIDHLQIQSILDVGSGTGRVVSFIKRIKPEVRIIGIEPVEALRQIGHRNGLAESDLIDGDATALDSKDGAFDLVCEFGVLHHIRHPERAIAEMLRVAKKGIFISDCNNFGQGSAPARAAKQLLNAAGLWKLAFTLKTGGKGYTISEGDGLAYSFSVFNHYEMIAKGCRAVHVLNTSGNGMNAYRAAGHVALLGIKK